ncbi:hypothetical protein A6J60_009895 [Psychrobacter sp. FDAARGOS_221]|nr:hypothetical protein A6J60_009895 [Psychrobacter sp. FDAARGOS_221]
MAEVQRLILSFFSDPLLYVETGQKSNFNPVLVMVVVLADQSLLFISSIKTAHYFHTHQHFVLL